MVASPGGDGTAGSDSLLALVELFQVLKRVPRTGWLLRGVPPGEAENVAAHTCGVALVALSLAELIDQPTDRGKLLAMCLLHDLPEARSGDLPTPITRYLPAGAKADAERQVIESDLQGLDFATDWLDLWEEFKDGDSLEARLARDADRLDMLLQAHAYESAGRRGLDEFWPKDYPWEVAASERLWQQLVERRKDGIRHGDA